MKLEKAIEQANDFLSPSRNISWAKKADIGEVTILLRKDKEALRLVIEGAEKSEAKIILSFLQKVISREDGINELIAFLNGTGNQLEAFIEKVLEGK